MKKYIVLLATAIVICCILVYVKYQVKVNNSMTNFENSPYTSILNKEISSAELATIINKAMNKNADNKIEKDDKGYYLENDENSIKIDVHFLINDTILTGEQIERSNETEFITAYHSAKFKCTKIEYHKKSKLAKHIYFEELEG